MRARSLKVPLPTPYAVRLWNVAGLRWRGMEIARSRLGNEGKATCVSISFVLKKASLAPANREGYTLVVQPDFIAVVGSSPAGTYYGVQTLAQMAVANSDAGWIIPCGSVTDWPDFPFRGVYIQDSDMDQVRAFSEKKINAVVFEGFLNMLDPDSPDSARQIFDECRQYGIEPIPMIQGFRTRR